MSVRTRRETAGLGFLWEAGFERVRFDVNISSSILTYYRGTCKTPVANGSDMIAVAYTI